MTYLRPTVYCIGKTLHRNIPFLTKRKVSFTNQFFLILNRSCSYNLNESEIKLEKWMQGS